MKERKMNVDAIVAEGGGFGKIEALKKLGYDVDIHTNLEHYLMINDKARMDLWKAFELLKPHEAKGIAARLCASCEKVVGKAPISADGQNWCKRAHIPGYIQERIATANDASVGFVAIGPDGIHMNESIDGLRVAMSDPNANIQMPNLPKEIMDHKCADPKCVFKQLKEIKAMVDSRSRGSLAQQIDDSTPDKWN